MELKRKERQMELEAPLVVELDAELKRLTEKTPGEEEEETEKKKTKTGEDLDSEDLTSRQLSRREKKGKLTKTDLNKRKEKRKKKQAQDKEALEKKFLRSINNARTVAKELQKEEVMNAEKNSILKQWKEEKDKQEPALKRGGKVVRDQVGI